MIVRVEQSWSEQLALEFGKEYFKSLTMFVHAEYKKGSVYPPPQLIFKALDTCAFTNVKVVIVGQDPYHGYGQANGLSFSVNNGIQTPPSLQNIFKELSSDIGGEINQDTDLTRWARKGVLLLNATLTVRSGIAGSHQGKGWEQFTDAILKKLNDERDHIVFILWGNYARKKGAFIDRAKHCVIESPHPSPLSAHNGFFGSKPFSKTNQYLIEKNIVPIEW
jgi:uracil-DNA glycosylase